MRRHVSLRSAKKHTSRTWPLILLAFLAFAMPVKAFQQSNDPSFFNAPSSLPSATVGTAYSETIQASGSVPITWTVAQGSLPAGLSLNFFTGILSGTPQAAGAAAFTLRATNLVGTSTKQFTITINSAVSIFVAPASSVLTNLQTVLLSATVSGRVNNAVTWTISPPVGTISTAGLYAAPSNIAGPTSVIATAISVADPTKSGRAIINLNADAVSLTPGTVSLTAAQTQLFTPVVAGGANTAVTWSLNPTVGEISSSGVYTAPTSISKPQTVTLTATSNGADSKSASAQINLTPLDTDLALGKTYTVTCPYPDVLWSQYQQSYPDPVPSKLTDGLTSATDWGYYAGYLLGDRRLITVDLGADSMIHRVSADFLQVNGAAVFFPLTVTFSISSDSVNWATLGAVQSSIPTSDTQTLEQSFQLTNLNVAGRYLQVEVPVDFWIFMDEINIWGWNGVYASPQPAAPQVMPAPLGYPQPSTGNGDAHHQVLIFTGYTNDNITQWTPADFKPYVTYVDTSGTSRDTMFDSFLFTPVATAQSGRVFDGGANPSNLADWSWLLDQMFAPSYQLSALDTAVATARITLGSLPKARVVIAIPFASPLMTNFGDIYGTGAIVNFNHLQVGDNAALTNRSAAVQWYIDQVLSRWKAAGFHNLTLVGFYWYMESIMNDVSPIEEQLVAITASYIHSAGYQFSWIPGNDSPGFRQTSQFGFNMVNMQPSYMFETVPASRLTRTATLANQYGLGIEMELDDTILQSSSAGTTDRAKLMAYLDYGLSEHYMNSFVAWYQQVKTLESASQSTDSTIRNMYDLVYQFIKGKYVRSALTVYP